MLVNSNRLAFIGIFFLLFSSLFGCDSKEQDIGRTGLSNVYRNMPIHRGKKVALVIGNEDYFQSGAKLSHPKQDAILIAEALKKQDFELLGGKVHINLNKADMKSILLDFQKMAVSADAALIYYAGHGLQDKDENGKMMNYLVPIDALIPSRASIIDEAVSLGRVLRHLNDAGSRVNLIFLDACRNNPFAEQNASRDLGVSYRGLGRVEVPKEQVGDTLISYSTSEGKRANDDSPYAETLAKMIEDNSNLPIETLLKEVGREVETKTNNDQSPYYIPLQKQDFCFGSCQQVLSPSIEYIEPNMVKIESGNFTMGCQSGRDDLVYGCGSDEKLYSVKVNEFEMSETEVTFDEWDLCYRDKICNNKDDNNWGRGDRPVVGISWDDAQKYIGWLNGKTKKNYRLPSEAEWEYAARANTNTLYSWGNAVKGQGKANCKDCGSQFDGVKTSPVKSFSPNQFGLYDMHGNVWEWCQDWYFQNAFDEQIERKSKSYKVLRGGSWANEAPFMRSATRNNLSPQLGFKYTGFRLVLSK
jgi:formylglycine-generating enzyme required for sulfatase activity